MGCCGSPNSSNMVSCLSRRWPLSVSTMALVDRRSWMKSGRGGASKDSRSALPVPARKGRPRRRSRPTGRGGGGGALDQAQEPLAQLAGGVLAVPVERGGERRVVPVGGRRLLLPELRLRPDVGAHGARRLLGAVGLRGRRGP